MTALDCDYFSDSYSCIFRQCSGYKTPFPIVRLGRVDSPSFSSLSTGKTCTHPCIALSRNDSRFFPTTSPNKSNFCSEAYLLHLKHDIASLPACVSFLELLCSDGPSSPVRIPPPSIDTSCTFFRELEEQSSLISLVHSNTTPQKEVNSSTSPDDQKASALFWKHNDERNQRICSSLQSVLSVALTKDGGAWCLATVGRNKDGGIWGSGSNEDEAVVLRFDQPSLFSPTNQPFFTQKVSSSMEPSALSIEQMDTNTAAVFSSDSVRIVDSRERPHSSARKSLLNFDSYGGMWTSSFASDHLVIGYSKKQEILAFDFRKPNFPIDSFRTPTIVGIRSQMHEPHALLLSGEQVAVLHFSPFSVVGAVQIPGIDTVVDAVMTSNSSSFAHLRVSTMCGMLYDWSVSQ